MALRSGFPQNNLSMIVLRNAALAIMLSAQVSPARAEPVTLTCRADEGSATFTFRINYDTGLVEQLGPSGDAYTNRVATATISPNAIVWSIDQPSSYMTGDNVTHETTEHWEGHLDRLAATGWTRSQQGDFPSNQASFTCRQATQKF